LSGCRAADVEISKAARYLTAVSNARYPRIQKITEIRIRSLAGVSIDEALEATKGNFPEN
jgi:hypothetical protein